MKTRALLLAAILALPGAMPAQIVPALSLKRPDTAAKAPVTPTDYLKLYQKNSNDLYQLATDSYKIRDDSVFRAIQMIARVLARSYVARFQIDSVPPSELRSLAGLFQAADATDSAARAIRRYVALASTDSARGEGLLDLVRYAAMGEIPALLKQIDALGGPPSTQFQARNSVLWRDSVSFDFQRQLVVDAVRILARFPEKERKSQAWTVGRMFSTLITRARDNGLDRVADTLIKEGLEALEPYGNTPTRAIRQLSLIGKKVPVLEATHWLNAPKGQTSYDPSGKLTLLMITAHW